MYHIYNLVLAGHAGKFKSEQRMRKCVWESGGVERRRSWDRGVGRVGVGVGVGFVK